MNFDVCTVITANCISLKYSRSYIIIISHGVGGETYIRWGRTTCPNKRGTTQVYTGWAAGSHYGHKGGGANYLCLTETPQYLKFSTATKGYCLGQSMKHRKICLMADYTTTMYLAPFAMLLKDRS